MPEGSRRTGEVVISDHQLADVLGLPENAFVYGVSTTTGNEWRISYAVPTEDNDD